MSGLVGCELCEREGVEANGSTWLGGRVFEVCRDCRTIISETRGKIAQLSAPWKCSICGKSHLHICMQFDEGKAPAAYQSLRRPSGDWCPSCGASGSVGVGSAEGHPGCALCLWRMMCPTCDWSSGIQASPSPLRRWHCTLCSGWFEPADCPISPATAHGQT